MSFSEQREVGFKTRRLSAYTGTCLIRRNHLKCINSFLFQYKNAIYQPWWMGGGDACPERYLFIAYMKGVVQQTIAIRQTDE